MKHSKESRNLVRQNENLAQKSQKHDANLQKNSTLYFQVGLILCLLASYAGLEMRFERTIDTYADTSIIDDEIVEITMDKYKIYEEPKIELKPQVKNQSVIIKDEIKVIDNDDEQLKKSLEKIVTVAPPVTTKAKLKVDDAVLDIVEPEEEFTMANVQKVPVYPGCERETNNSGRRKCMSEKIGKLIQKKFNGGLAQDLGLSPGIKKIDVFFKINKVGEVEILRTRAPHPSLEQEAKRVINKIPTMSPGMYNKTPVNVTYNVPIKFQVQD